MKLALVIAAIVLSCSDSLPEARPGAPVTPTSTLAASPSIPAWQVHLAMPPDDARYSFFNVNGLAATRSTRPTVVAAARFSTADGTNIGTAAPPGETEGEVLDVEPRGSDWLVTTVEDRYVISRGAGPEKATRWYALSPGVMSVEHAANRAIVTRFDAGKPTPTWRQTLPDAALRDAHVVAWLSDAAVLAVEHAADTQLVRVQLADGHAHSIASLPATGVVVATSESSGTFAAIFNERPECALCPRVEVRELGDGRVAHSFKLPVDIEPFPLESDRGNASVGFDGHQVWFFAYYAHHQSDVLGTSTGERCTYDVFDTQTGAKLRTLAGATGQWGALSQSCRTRSLVPMLDGGVLVLAIDDASHATISKFASPP